MAIPRSASAGGSSRRATRLSALSGSPARSARAAAVTSESMAHPTREEIPSHLLLPARGTRALSRGSDGEPVAEGIYDGKAHGGEPRHPGAGTVGGARVRSRGRFGPQVPALRSALAARLRRDGGGGWPGTH